MFECLYRKLNRKLLRMKLIEEAKLDIPFTDVRIKLLGISSGGNINSNIASLGRKLWVVNTMLKDVAEFIVLLNEDMVNVGIKDGRVTVRERLFVISIFRAVEVVIKI